MAYASVDDEVDHLDQKITNALHQIDENFSNAREASTVLLKNVQRFGKEIGRVHEGLKVWRHFFSSFCDEGSAQKLLASEEDSTIKKRHSPPSSDDPNTKTKRQRTGESASNSSTPLNSSGFDFSINMSPPKTTFFLQEPNGMPTSGSDEGEDRSIDKDGTQTPNTGALRRTSVGSSKSPNNISGSRWEAMKKLQSSIKTPLVRATAHAGIASPGGLITPLVKSPPSREFPATTSGKRKRVDIDHVDSPKTPGLASPLKRNYNSIDLQPAENQGGTIDTSSMAAPASVTRKVQQNVDAPDQGGSGAKSMTPRQNDQADAVNDSSMLLTSYNLASDSMNITASPFNFGK